MPLQVPVASPKIRTGLGVALNGADLLVSLFLIFGGFAIADRHSLIMGCVTVSCGLFLIYLSSGMWTKQRWKLMIRFVLYAGAFAILGLITVVGLIQRHLSSDDVFLYLVAAGFLAVVLLSAAYFRVVAQPKIDKA